LTVGVKPVNQKKNMKISLSIPRPGLNPATGFGYAAQNIVKSLQNLGHIVTWTNANTPLQLNFTQPHHYKMHRGQYQIGYTPWESTGIRPEWTERMNLCDEVWATSDWNAEVFKNNGVTVPIKTYTHGIEKIWTPHKRELREGRPFKFLHVGEPAPRKSGQLVVDTFIRMFGDNPDYQLTIKSHHSHTIRVYDKYGNFGLPENIYNNIKVIKDEYSAEQLVSLYHSHHVLIYPSWGEGFGFIPLQALATGMPTITTYDWAQYKKYIGPLKLKSKLSDEELPKAIGDPHLGLMFKPDEKHLEELMYESVINFKAYSGYYFAQSTKIHEEYDWIKLTKNAFSHLEEKFS